MRRPLSAALTLSIIVAASLARAQGATPQMSYEAVVGSKQGAWAEYETSTKGKPGAVKVRYSLVEKSAKHLALEVDTSAPALGQVLIRLDYEPVSPTEWKLAQARMLAGGQTQEMPLPPAGNNLKKGDVGKPVGKAAIKTAVGTFECRQYRATVPQGTFDVYMSDQVHPVGLVKQTDEAGVITTVLTATGSDARSKLPK